MRRSLRGWCCVCACFDPFNLAASNDEGQYHTVPSRGKKISPSDNKEMIITLTGLILKVADASPIPTMIYNFPRVTAGIDLDSSIITELATHPNIVGVKLSCGNIGKLHRITTATKLSEFAVFPGRSDVFAQGLLSGSAGGIVALANIAPKVHTRLFKLWTEGNQDEAM